MHIGDNVLPSSVWIGGYAVAAAATGGAALRLRESAIPRTAVMTSLFFAVSWIQIPLPIAPVTSIHLVLNGLMGIVLGWLAVPAVLIALAFQLLLFGYGGVTTLGVNTVNLAAGALAARAIFSARRWLPASRWREVAIGFACGAAGVLVSACLYFACLLSAGETFREAARIAFIFHLPVMVIEGIVTAFAVAFLATVSPGLLEGRAT